MNGRDDASLTIGNVLTVDGEGSLHAGLNANEVTARIDGRLDAVPPGLRGLARDEVMTVVLQAIDAPLVDVLAAGWKKWQKLDAAVRRSMEDPQASELVELHDQHMTSTHRPRIDVTLDEKPIAHVELALELDMLLHAVTAVVANGRVTALRTGRADVTARLSVEGVQVVEKTRSIELPIEIGLGGGIPLLGLSDVVVLPPSPSDQPSTPL